MAPQRFLINTASANDFEWIKELYIQTWGANICVSRGKVQKVDDFTGGFIAEASNKLPTTLRSGYCLFQLRCPASLRREGKMQG